MTTERLVSGKPLEEDLSLDTSLRPRRLADYVGQDGVKSNLEIAITAAKQRGEPLDHVLIYGPPGLGKTTLANIMATEMGVRIKTTSGPAIERPGDMVDSGGHDYDEACNDLDDSRVSRGYLVIGA